MTLLRVLNVVHVPMDTMVMDEAVPEELRVSKAPASQVFSVCPWTVLLISVVVLALKVILEMVPIVKMKMKYATISTIDINV